LRGASAVCALVVATDVMTAVVPRRGKEDALFRALVTKYGPEPDPEDEEDGGDDDEDDDGDDDDDDEARLSDGRTWMCCAVS
jgi:hypothetical protein